MARQLDRFMHVRVGADQKAALEAVAKARGETAGALVRAAIDAVVLKGGAALTEGQREEVVAKAAPAVAAALGDGIDPIADAMRSLADRVAALETEAR